MLHVLTNNCITIMISPAPVNEVELELEQNFYSVIEGRSIDVCVVVVNGVVEVDIEVSVHVVSPCELNYCKNTKLLFLLQYALLYMTSWLLCHVVQCFERMQQLCLKLEQKWVMYAVGPFSLTMI